MHFGHLLRYMLSVLIHKVDVWNCDFGIMALILVWMAL